VCSPAPYWPSARAVTAALNVDIIGNECGHLTIQFVQRGNLILDRDVIGRPQPWVVTHRGLEYPGEVVLAGATDPSLGQRLTGGLCFRVVIHTEPRRLSSVPIDDPRIAMCVPRRSTQPGRDGAGREIQAIRETKERYMAGEDSLRRSMSERESSLMAEIARQEGQNYS
jgi:hypothetical protein